MAEHTAPSRSDELLTSLYQVYDELLRRGVVLPALPSGGATSTSGDLEGDLQFLQMLHKYFAKPVLPGAEPTPVAGMRIGPEGTLEQLGQFEVRQTLGRGGFGTVYRAFDSQLGRDVALKVPHWDRVTNADAQARFRLEALAAARLDHPHIVKVHEADTCGTICYLVTELCDSRTLADFLRASVEPLPWTDTARLLLALADAVHHAHSRGVLHRDLKPANVLQQMSKAESPVSKETPDAGTGNMRQASFGVPKIADFGLAKFLEEQSNDVTKTGTVLGSANYMAPEQAAGKVREIGVATDVHALGVIAYELFTGKLPYAADTPAETLQRVQLVEPVPPRVLRPKLPRDLETICLKCLRKDPSQRYGSAAALADDLRRWLTGEPIQARPVGRVERGLLWVRRHPWQAVLVTVLVLALAVVSWFWRVAVVERQRAEEFAQMPIRAMGDFTDRVLERREFGDLHLAKVRAAVLEATLPHLENYLRHSSLHEWAQIELAATHYRLGQVRHMLGKPEEALRHIETALQVAETEVAKDPQSNEKRQWLARICFQRAQFVTDRPREEAKGYERALEHARKIGDYGIMSRCHFNLAFLIVGPEASAGTLEERQRALEHLRQAWTLTEALTANEDNPQSGLPPCTALDHVVLLITGRMLCEIDKDPVRREAMAQTLMAAAERSRQRYEKEAWAWNTWGECVHSACLTYGRLGQQQRSAEVVEQAYALLEKKGREQLTWARHLRVEFRYNQGRTAHHVAEALYALTPRPQAEVIRWSALAVDRLEPVMVLEPENAWGRYMLALSHFRLTEPLRSEGSPALWDHYRHMRQHMEASLQHRPDLGYENDYADYCLQYVDDLVRHGRSPEAVKVLQEMIRRIENLQKQHPEKAKHLPLAAYRAKLADLSPSQR
jgi:tetratricopeptide (TPR) repeat protein